MYLVCTLKSSVHVLPRVLELLTEEGCNLVLKGSLVLLVMFILVCHARILLDDVGLMQCESSSSVQFVLLLRVHVG